MDNDPEPCNANAFRVFACLFACVQLIELLAWPFWVILPWGWLVFFGCGAVLLKPASAGRFAFLALALAIKIFSEMPFVPNHVLFTEFVCLVLLATYVGTRLRAGRTVAAGEWFEVFAPAVRAMVIALYFAAALQKLNRDYLDSEISCAAISYLQVAADLKIFPTGDWVRPLTTFGSLATEVGIPILLLFARTRPAGVLVAFLFHGFLSFHENPGVYGFTALMLCLMALFLPGRVLDRMATYPGRRPFDVLRLGAGRPAAWLLLWCFFAVLRGQVWLYWNVGREQPVFYLANRIGLVFWSAMLVWVTIGFAMAILPELRGRWVLKGRLRLAPALFGVALVLANTAMPWIGAKTQTSFSMFSNLRTEFGANHLFLSRLPLFGFQDEMVEVIGSRPDLFAPAVNPYSIQQFANEGRIMPVFELRRLLSQVEGAVEVEYRQGGETKRAARRKDGELSGELGLFEAPTYLQRKWLWFRRHQSFEGPMPCTH